MLAWAGAATQYILSSQRLSQLFPTAVFQAQNSAKEIPYAASIVAQLSPDSVTQYSVQEETVLVGGGTTAEILDVLDNVVVVDDAEDADIQYTSPTINKEQLLCTAGFQAQN